MSVFYCIPSKRPASQCLPVFQRWREMGYHVIIQRDPGEVDFELEKMVRIVERKYVGYAEAVNHLTSIALGEGAEWVVTGGDDILPDPTRRASEISAECIEHFKADWLARGLPGGSGLPEWVGIDDTFVSLSTFGVMQPTGDRWGEQPDAHDFKPLPTNPKRCGCGREKDCDQHLMGAYIDRVAGSPWMGREFCKRINQGKGPLWPEYFHFGEDEEVQHVALKYGVFWQRRDLTHQHNHWARPKQGKKYGNETDRPAFLDRANSREEWQAYKALFTSRQAAGFPGSEPL